MRREWVLPLIAFTGSVALLVGAWAVLVFPDVIDGRARYAFSFRDVSGLHAGAEVVVSGYAVGRVRAIRPNYREGTFIVEAALDREWHPVQQQTVAIAQPNPFKPALLQVGIAQCAAPITPLPLASLPTCGRIPNAIDIANSTLGQLRHWMETNRGKMDGADGTLADLGKILRNVETITSNVATLTAAKSTDTLPTTLRSLSDLLAETTKAVKSTQGSIEQFKDPVTGALNESRLLIRSSSLQLQTILMELEELTRNLNAMTGHLRDDPSVIIRGRSYHDGEKR